VIGLWLVALPAAATVPDAFGVGARWSGAGAAGVAVVEDGAAAALNPAGLSRVRRPTAGVGFTLVDPTVRAIPPLWWDTNRDGLTDENDEPLSWDAGFDSVLGVQLQAARPLGGRFGLGFSAFVPSSTVVRFKTIEPELPNYVLWENRLQRFSAAAGIAGKVLPGVNIGISADLLARAKLSVALTADISASVEGTASTAGDLVTGAVIDVHYIDLNVVPAVAPIVGIAIEPGDWVDALDGLVLAAAYHSALGLPIDVDLDLQANVAASDVGELDPIVGAVVADAGLALFDHYVPQRVSLGIAWRRAEVFTIYAETRWTDWTGLQANVARLTHATISAPLFSVPPDKVTDDNSAAADAAIFRAVWSVHMGSELRLPEIPTKGKCRYFRPTARGGFGYVPSALVRQSPASAFLDADRVYFTLGAGLEHWDPFALVDGPVRYDLFFQYHSLASTTLLRSADTPTPGFPVDPKIGVPVGGNIIVFGGQWGFDY
jgi:long-subunit fatty acid transport protein